MMERLLAARKLGYLLPSTSSLVNGWHYNTAQISGYPSLVCLNHRSFNRLSTLDSLDVYTVVAKPDNGFSCSFLAPFSTMTGMILVQARDPARLAVELGNALDERRFEDAWKFYEQYMLMEGFPRKSILSKLIAGFTESDDRRWLDKAYSLVELVFNEGKHQLLEKECLIYHSFVLARCGLPVPASTILRKIVEFEEFVPITAWSGIIAHMSRTAQGAYLAAELVLEIGHLFKDNRVDPRKKCNRPLLSMKPDTTVFNITLVGCLLFGTARKAEQLLELMPRIGVKPDATSLIIMVHIYERNGRREEIKKLKRYIDEACGLGDFQFQQFYNCLLSCHLKFGDLDSASEMVLEILRKSKEARSSLSAATLVLEAVGTGGKPSHQKQSSVQAANHIESSFSDEPAFIGSAAPSFLEFSSDKKFSRLEAEAHESLDLLLGELQMQVELVTSDRGILRPTERIYAKLVKAYLEADKLSDLAMFLIRADKEDGPVSADKSAVVHVIDACISLQWLDKAHDLLDEMQFAGVRIGSAVYSSLLKAYCKANRAREVTLLLRDARKAGVQIDSSCYEALIQSRVLQKDTSGALHLFKEMKEAKISKTGHPEFEMLVKGCAESGEAGLMAKLLEEIKEEQRADCGVHDWNSVIYFFCKKRLMHDAQKALKKMKALGHQPNAQTFHSLVTGYAALGGKYIEITELWGEMKALASSSPIKFDQELLDSLLYSFVRGGFFLRANEVVEMMEGEGLFIDKYKYRTLFLKYHRTFYKGKAPKFQTEAQCKRREAALAFKKWAGVF
ncbi:pentatricopeptide repeat-containing protein At1g03100, mitochondrial [Magnolia sinica]|uniref:pentatricopeptide repeat-containing protein At1g03100, mitochondrial n=1 Tax=Magnolia sinica TaxID=86752 RepID=UPI0026596B31|nr:pentatricopeptide repeat-containing protein At1g03100, mitochondrial [Magnolia sinica]XP_058106168.1 pentatricopeptide repeat-containing protein At1g03100, mitochondrial [Magnolia sinica]XP_058106169.1 pentatricopeptide repeat-containing protein At1g03100, mitochondrial [Magnolia sinica]XP_058106171.1 pentatricopeptide repeat-containing protein At1g03100, mitochondrial [Magnolia sinica]XP_058106172.1 pentatricopeptide repeat-containing protein At1g03100, mitochondrial [Magnolia sinica]XP_05